MNCFEDLIITISGLPGSGTSTTTCLLSEKTGMKIVSTGEIFRKMAKENQLSLEEFGKVAEKNEEIDKGLDSRIIDEAEKGRILEGRLTGHMLHRSGRKAFKVWLKADRDTRIKRISDRENEPVEDVRDKVIHREHSERKRYKKYYDITLHNTSIYDMVLDTKKYSPEEIVEKIMEGLKDEICEREG